jgi:hypothetical protein
VTVETIVRHQPGRRQQQASPAYPFGEGALADTTGPVLSCSIDPEPDLEQIIFDRVASRSRLSTVEMERLTVLRRKHGPDFIKACDLLHSGVTNPTAYLTSVLEPGAATEMLTRKLKIILLRHATNNRKKAGGTHG